MIELRVVLVDYNMTDEDGQPYALHNQRSFSEYEVARMDAEDIAEHTLELGSRDILAHFRGDEYGDE